MVIQSRLEVNIREHWAVCLIFELKKDILGYIVVGIDYLQQQKR